MTWLAKPSEPEPNTSSVFLSNCRVAPRGEVGLVFAGIGSALTLERQRLMARAAFCALVLAQSGASAQSPAADGHPLGEFPRAGLTRSGSRQREPVAGQAGRR
jgi:hypothetical protein